MGIKSNLRNLLRASIKNNYTEDINLSNINISKKHNIYTTDIAITIAQKLKKDPRLVAEKIAKNLYDNKVIDKITIDNIGIIEITLQKSYLLEFINDIINEKSNYGRSNLGNAINISIECLEIDDISTLTSKNVCQAIYSDNLSRILSYCGYSPTKECYLKINNETLNKCSEIVKQYYKNICNGNLNKFDSEGKALNYYLHKIAKSIFDVHLIKKQNESLDFFKEEVINNFINDIKIKLDKFRINFDYYIKSSDLYINGIIEDTLSKLQPYTEIKSNGLNVKVGDDNVNLVTNDGTYTKVLTDLAYCINNTKLNGKNLITIESSPTKDYNTLNELLKLLKIDYKVYYRKLYLENIENLSESKLNDLFENDNLNLIRLFCADYISKEYPKTKLDEYFIKNFSNPFYYIEEVTHKIDNILLKNHEKLNILERNLQIINDFEYNLLEKLGEFSNIVLESCQSCNPKLIFNYVYELVLLYDEYNFKEREYNLKEINLLYATKIIISNSLELIGLIPREEI